MNYATLLLLFGNLLINNVASIVVKTAQGNVRGECLEVVTGNFKYFSFKGIPFAKPPLGDLRFRAPQPPESWSGIRNATEHGSVCVQLDIYNGVDISGNEDCLYLNVYTPKINPLELLPVIFFIHGGGFQTGSGNSDRYGPDYLITQNVILVTANHRLGALGFLSLNNREVPGNAGLKDQVAALRWIQKNIANFGGNPKEVTIIGHSSGAASVGLHNLSPMSKGLFKRSIEMSGSPFADWSVPFQTSRIAFRLGQQLGYWTRNNTELMEYLKCVPAEKLLGTNPAVLRSEEPRVSLKQFIFVPAVEINYGLEHFMTISSREALKKGKVNNVDLMIGHTANEAAIEFLFGVDSVPELYTNYTEMLVPREILENITPIQLFRLADKIHARYFGNKQIDNDVRLEFIKYLSDVSFHFPVTKYARLFSKFHKTFMYKFSKLTTFPRYVILQNESGTSQAIHEDDLLYVFHSNKTTIDKTSDDYKVIQTMSTLYANFAKYGNPTPDKVDGVTWPRYEESTGYYMDIDTKLTVGRHFDEEMVTFWDSIYEKAGLGY